MSGSDNAADAASVEASPFREVEVIAPDVDAVAAAFEQLCTLYESVFVSVMENGGNRVEGRSAADHAVSDMRVILCEMREEVTS